MSQLQYIFVIKTHGRVSAAKKATLTKVCSWVHACYCKCFKINLHDPVQLATSSVYVAIYTASYMLITLFGWLSWIVHCASWLSYSNTRVSACTYYYSCMEHSTALNVTPCRLIKWTQLHNRAAVKLVIVIYT